MKITKNELKQIIKEEMSAILSEGWAEDVNAEQAALQGGASVRSFERDVEDIVSRAQDAGIPDQDLAEVLQMYAANLGGNF
tara:strand:+ start:210 stop:452 length:243 start_codon:yes stop_codon:yes gene_type:complete